MANIIPFVYNSKGVDFIDRLVNGQAVRGVILCRNAG